MRSLDNKRLVALGLCGLAFIRATVAAPDEVAGITDATKDRREHAASEIRTRWQREISGLVAAARGCLEGPRRGDRCAEIVELLGTMRAADAAPLFAKHLLYDPKVKAGLPPEGGPRPWKVAYPCAGALTSIGVDALPSVVSEVLARDDDRYRQMAAQVLRGVLADVAESYVRNKIDGATEAGSRTALEKLLACVAADGSGR